MGEGHLTVSEIFFSVQGEGLCVGAPMVFVRFVGCNLACGFCDSAYASHPKGDDTVKVYEGKDGVKVLAGEILGLVKHHQCTQVCFTGGEPAVQDENLMMALVVILVDAGVELSLETNGVERRYWMDSVDWLTVSPKDVDPEAFTRDYTHADELKYVLEPGKVLPEFKGDLPDNMLVMPMTKQPFADNLEFNLRSYNWAASAVMKTPGWRLTGRLQELAKIR